MKLKLEITLGNDGMRDMSQVRRALANAVWRSEHKDYDPLVLGESKFIKDANGNTVGHWEVVEDDNGKESG